MTRSLIAATVLAVTATASVASAHPTSNRGTLNTVRPGTVTYVMAKRHSDFTVTAWRNPAGQTPGFTMPAVFNNPMTKMWLGMWGWSELKNGIVQY